MVQFEVCWLLVVFDVYIYAFIHIGAIVLLYFLDLIVNDENNC
jgi:hypothetical protein